MNSIDLKNRKHFFADIESWDFIQDMIFAVSSIGAIAGKNLILSGCGQNGSGAVHGGFVVINGEICKFEGGAVSSYVSIVTDSKDVEYKGDKISDLYRYRTVKFGAGTSSNKYAWSSFTRISLDSLLTAINSHKNSNSNPHAVTAAQVGLESVDNTSDVNKPLSTAMRTALGAKSNTVHTHTKSDVELGKVENKSDSEKMNDSTNAIKKEIDKKAQITHSHSIGSITNLQAGLNKKAEYKTKSGVAKMDTGIEIGKPRIENNDNFVQLNESGNVVSLSARFHTVKGSSSVTKYRDMTIDFGVSADNNLLNQKCILIHEVPDKWIEGRVVNNSPLKIKIENEQEYNDKYFIINTILPTV